MRFAWSITSTAGSQQQGHAPMVNPRQIGSLFPLGRESWAWVLAVATALSVWSLVTLSPALFAAEPSIDIYQYAGECVALRDRLSGRYVARDSSRYRTTPFASNATPFHMQATGLGRYMLYGIDARMPAAGLGGSVVATGGPGPKADWAVSEAGGALQLTNVSTGLSLSVNWLRRLTQKPELSARWRFEPASGCSAFPEVGVDVAGTPAPVREPEAEVRGLVDAHVHVTAFEFLGGRFHCGRPWSPYGVSVALKDCPDHGARGRLALAENLVSTGSLTGMHSSQGWPNFGSPDLPGWPRYDSLTHEGTYWKGIERAWRAGLRVMVVDLVENRALCELYWLGGNPCTDMASIRLQAQGLYDLQEYIDAQFKGLGNGFFRIVTSPEEAREVINQGKLAVVIGVETSQPFDCLYQEGVEICSEQQIDDGLQELWDLGVRSLFPVHKFDNAFGGTAMDAGTTGILVNLGNRYMTGRWWEVEECTGDEHDRTPGSLGPGPSDAYLELAESDPDLRIFDEKLTEPLLSEALPSYPPGPVCNVRGLTELGEYLINRMIDMGMIIETDHLSAKARDRALEILEERGYSGVITSHSWGGSPSRVRIQALGGIVSPYANSSTDYIDEWEEARATQPEQYLWGIAYGTDTNGLGQQAAPRPGALGDNPVTYPFPSFDGSATILQSRWGSRLWDFNLDGASHYGLFADWVEDLEHVAGPDILDDLGIGAEAYMQMWERATASAGPE
jgi:microsomal dipeptidase-like Zn-dependent dipeptidase